MRNYSALLLMVVLLLAVIAGCPRKAPEGTATPPPAGSTTDQNQTSQTPPGETTTTPPTTGETTPEGTTPVTPPEAGKGETAPVNKPGETAPADKVTKVTLDTTKGKIVLAVHEAWSPEGAKHFLELVNDKFYDGAPWFRVIDGFVAQCGVSRDPAMNEKWADKTIPDEPLVQGNKRGMVAFGKTSMPNSRSTHFFINYADNTPLDGQGFSCFAEVVEGMDVADKLTRCEFGDQNALAAPGGMQAFKKMFPTADYITKATVQK